MRLGSSLLLASAALATGGCATVSSQSIGDTFAPDLPRAAITPDTSILEDGDCPDSNDPCIDAPVAAAVAPAPVAPAVSGRSALPGQGIAYFLPRQLARVTVKRGSKTLDEAIADVGKKQLAMNSAAAAQAAIEGEIVKITEAIASNPDDVRVRDLLLNERTSLIARLAKAQTAAADAKKAHQATIDTATKMKVQTAGYDTTLLIELLPPSADPNYGFRMKALHNPFRDDDHKIEVTPTGLLTSTDITATDRTGDVLVELAGLAGYAAGFARNAAMPGCKGVVEQVVSVVDFARDSDVRQLNADLHCSGVKISVAGSLGEQVKTLGNYPLQAAIMYRTPIEVPLRIEICAIPCNSPSDWQLREVRYLSLPQAGPISMLPQNAGIMTKTRYINAFKDGMLVKYDSSRPSEAIRIAETPVRLIDSFFGGVSKVISLRTGRNDQEAKLSASDLALLQALERDQAIREAFDKCATEKRAAGETILACLPTKAD